MSDVTGEDRYSRTSLMVRLWEARWYLLAGLAAVTVAYGFGPGRAWALPLAVLFLFAALFSARPRAVRIAEKAKDMSLKMPTIKVSNT